MTNRSPAKPPRRTITGIVLAALGLPFRRRPAKAVVKPMPVVRPRNSIATRIDYIAKLNSQIADPNLDPTMKANLIAVRKKIAAGLPR